jgi:hypothetical protein
MPIDISAAQAYNKSKAGILWKVQDLPTPFKSYAPESETFAVSVAVFQQAHALKVDGCLGPATLATLRAVIAEGLPSSDTQTIEGPVNKPAVIPGRLGTSNKIILNGNKMSAPFSCTNFVDDQEPKFKFWKRSQKVTHICFHESVTRDAPTAIRVLQAGGLGAHLILCPDGHVSQHNDLVSEQPAHANQLNGCSVGLEIINPYSPLYAKPPYTRTISATWWTWIPAGAPKQYTLPTEAQLQTLKILVPWLCTNLTVPQVFPTEKLNKVCPKIKGWNKSVKPASGIVAHSDFSSHADGRYELEYLIQELK